MCCIEFAVCGKDMIPLWMSEPCLWDRVRELDLVVVFVMLPIGMFMRARPEKEILVHTNHKR